LLKQIMHLVLRVRTTKKAPVVNNMNISAISTRLDQADRARVRPGFNP